MRGDKKGWYKVSDLRPGVEIAVPRDPIREGQTLHPNPKGLTFPNGEDVLWDEIVSITPVGREQVYDIEVEGTHNFIGNGIFAHNTYALRVNTMLAVTGEVNADDFTVPLSDGVFAFGTTTLAAEIPSTVLTADGKGVDLYKLSTYNLAGDRALAARMDTEELRVTSLETRVEKLESGAITSASGSPLALSTSSLASALEGFGVLIRNGIAQFNTLVFRQLVASRDADGTSSAGSVSILIGNTVAQVNNSLVLPSTKVFITFNSQIAGSWWVSDKAAGSFRVVLSAAQTTDVSFDYFLVQTEGQIATSTPAGVAGSLTSSDSVAPVITLLGDNPMHLAVGGTFIDPGITVVDNADGVIGTYSTFVDGIEQPADASTVTTTSETTHIITYKATDAAGNIATTMRSVIVGTTSVGSQTSQNSTDVVPPVVTLVGAAALELTVGGTFTDPGATALDAVDGDLTASIAVTGAVNTAVEGSYTLTYTAIDKASNTGSVSRLVTVIAAPAAGAATTTTGT